MFEMPACANLPRKILKSAMDTVRIVLTVPFMKYPAGTVFELDALQGVSGWDPDERVRERLSFSDKRTYHLPDTGRGYATELPASYTLPCLPEVFEAIDIQTGPCRVTAVGEGTRLREDDVSLVSLNGINAQGLRITLPAGAARPERYALWDVLRDVQSGGQKITAIQCDGAVLNLDFSMLGPGFYRVDVYTSEGNSFSIRFIKAFPLLVTFSQHNKYTVQKTPY